jgi:NADH dehydrogenase
MSVVPLDVVTGAFGYTGRYVTRRLHAAGRRVRTLTAKPLAASPFGEEVEAHPFAFEDRPRLVGSLRGADTLYNTYWVRFAHADVTYERAVANTRVLFAAAAEAGVRRIVHVSITNADDRSPLAYFRWKGVLERELAESGVSHAIVRPTVVFGREDILINNIAWLLRRLPLFVVPNGGGYRLQPVYVDDLAAMCVELAAADENVALDAVGPESYAFEELVRVVRRAVGSSSPVVSAPPSVAYALARLLGRLTNDVVLTRDELNGLRANLLVSAGPPTATTAFRAWVTEHGSELGRAYSSELARHYDGR